MHTLHEHVARKLADEIKSRRVVVWYDDGGELQPFVNELRGGARADSAPVGVSVAGTAASLVEYAGSFLEVRSIVEPLVGGDTPQPLIIYISGVPHDPKASLLMEIEKAGTTWKPELKQLAKQVLLQKYTLGVVDEMLPFDRKITYEDVARAASGGRGSEPPSILKTIFHDAKGNTALLAAWLSSDERDAAIKEKAALRELVKLVKAHIGLELDPDATLAKARAITLRYLLAGEFRLDLSCDAPASLEGVPKPPTPEAESAVRELARRLRSAHPDAYAGLADGVELELGLSSAKLAPGALGSIDTFRFEERALLRHAGELIAASRFDDALALVSGRDGSYWLLRDVARSAQWEAVGRMAELGRTSNEVHASVRAMSGDARAWMDAYVGTVDRPGWHRLDHAQRRLEAWLGNPELDDDVEERPLGVVRRAYDDACQAMTEGFVAALQQAAWNVPGALVQSRIYAELVESKPRPVAYFLVDAMRFEMGAELATRLGRSSEVALRAAVGSLPSITPVGMAALMPGAATDFSVVGEGGTSRVAGRELSDLDDRRKHAAARVPGLVDLALDAIFTMKPSDLKKKVKDATVIIVRSTEIDRAGEVWDAHHARQIMENVVSNLVGAVRRLARAGVEHAVITSDHGHLFGIERNDSMRIDHPNPKQGKLHRRAWLGRGGSTPPGSVRVTAAALGYDSDLDFVFPFGPAVFKGGGDLAFHHGGPSLQELVLPVLLIRTPTAEVSKAAGAEVTVTGAPDVVRNRIFSVTLTLGGAQLALDAGARQVRPLLISNGRSVGTPGMAVGADLDRASGCVTLVPGVPVTIGLLLTDDKVPSLRVVVQDPASDAELYRSPEIPVQFTI